LKRALRSRPLWLLIGYIGVLTLMARTYS